LSGARVRREWWPRSRTQRSRNGWIAFVEKRAAMAEYDGGF
jgi:hypothetical protein